ncbi:MAG: HD domain-containing protein, partial [Taibaiella sp.]|nr:HD domain-containing protein [Taibaiella sp.]
MNMKGKIVNDPVYGFIRFPEAEILQLIDHRWFQRLRYIRQMGPAHLVYPGAVHTRFHHSLGAVHLMGKALDELKAKGVVISEQESLAARIAILLHDIGHGPFSHALEHTLVEGITHEYLSGLIMNELNREFGGMLDGAIRVFDQSYEKPYLHQLVSSQLDVDRMDYLNRDSFYTGVSEGVIGYDRILNMLTVKNNQLMVEEKGVHSVEKFVIARRLMYWQVYLHKTVLAAEVLLINILKRARELARRGKELYASQALRHFLYNNVTLQDFQSSPQHLEKFCMLDDVDILASVKEWCRHENKILSRLCCMMQYRKLYKVVLTSGDINALAEEKRAAAVTALRPAPEELDYFV